jgi:hypothetical protein
VDWGASINTPLPLASFVFSNCPIGSSAIGDLEWALRCEFRLDLIRLEIRSKFGSYGKIGNDNERRPNMHQQKLVYICKVQKK